MKAKEEYAQYIKNQWDNATAEQNAVVMNRPTDQGIELNLPPMFDHDYNLKYSATTQAGFGDDDVFRESREPQEPQEASEAPAEDQNEGTARRRRRRQRRR